MLRVMCVNHDLFGDAVMPYGPTDPQIGDECEVVKEAIGYDNNDKPTPCFDLKGFSRYYYDQRNFATLPDSTADEMQEADQEAIVNLETVAV